jgi:hypothetical protein
MMTMMVAYYSNLMAMAMTLDSMVYLKNNDGNARKYYLSPHGKILKKAPECFGMSHCLTSVGKRRKSVSSIVSEFGRKYFAFREATFVSAIKATFQNIENHEYFRDNVSYVWPRL